MCRIWMQDNLGEAKFISTLDLSRGYWQLPVETGGTGKDSVYHTLWFISVSEDAIWPLPATFQRMVDKRSAALCKCLLG